MSFWESFCGRKSVLEGVLASAGGMWRSWESSCSGSPFGGDGRGGRWERYAGEGVGGGRWDLCKAVYGRGPACGTAGRDYFRKAKKTARTMQAKEATWFQWMASPLKKKVMMTEKMVREMTSWMTLSWMRLKGPPFWM